MTSDCIGSIRTQCEILFDKGLRYPRLGAWYGIFDGKKGMVNCLKSIHFIR